MTVHLPAPFFKHKNENFSQTVIAQCQSHASFRKDFIHIDHRASGSELGKCEMSSAYMKVRKWGFCWVIYVGILHSPF